MVPGRLAHVFDTTGWTGSRLAARLVTNEAELRQRECEVLVPRGWTDVPDIDTTAPGYEPLVERGVASGGEGCRDISEYAVHELAALRGTSSGTAEPDEDHDGSLDLTVPELLDGDTVWRARPRCGGGWCCTFICPRRGRRRARCRTTRGRRADRPAAAAHLAR